MVLRESLFDLGADFEREGVQALAEFANVLEKLVVENDGGNGDEEAGGSSDQSFGDARSYGAEASGAGIAEAGEGVNDAPDGAEKADERSDGAGGGQPGHALFDAAHFFCGGELHVDGDGLEAFHFAGGLGIASAGLTEQFAIAGGIDRGKRRAGGSDGLRIGDAAGGAEDAEKLVTLPTNAAEKTNFLENHRPGNNGENAQQYQNAAGYRSGLCKDAAQVGDEQRCEQENDEPLS